MQNPPSDQVKNLKTAPNPSFSAQLTLSNPENSLLPPSWCSNLRYAEQTHPIARDFSLSGFVPICLRARRVLPSFLCTPSGVQQVRGMQIRFVFLPL